jgi:hypothetical protein
MACPAGERSPDRRQAATAVSSGGPWWRAAASRRKQQRGRAYAARRRECRDAWKGAVAASLLLCDRCRSGASADRAPADAWISSPALVTDTRGRASRDFPDGRRSPRLGDPPQARRQHAPSSKRRGGAARDYAPGGRVANPRWGDAPSPRQQPACRRVRFAHVPGGGLKGWASRWATFSCQGGGALR